MTNANQEFLTSCRFYFEAEGLDQMYVLELSGMTAENPAAGGDKVLGSGQKGKNIRQASPTRTKFEQVVVKVVANPNINLYKWYADCNKNDGGSSDWQGQRKTAGIHMYSQADEELARWELTNAYPTKYEGPKLEAGSNDVANETITLVHEGIIRAL